MTDEKFWLDVRTKGDKNPRRLPKVYFCGAVTDRELYLEEIAQQIWGCQEDAAIWFPREEPDFLMDRETPAEERERRLADLLEMRLFVIPVTSALAEGKHPMQLAEMRFAAEHSIPLLPLLMEAGGDIARSFSELSGGREYLNPWQDDPTALPYEVKLRKFLEETLVSSEMTDRIRRAFSARIFLSYRKKDRAAAKVCMRQIHAGEAFRDVAIWYDEFLVPGRDFREEIRQAMRASQMMALVVTPHLLENPNYVMSTEYPMAGEVGIPVLPILEEETEEPELRRCYPGIAVCAEPGAELEKRLGEELGAVLPAVRPEDPEHLYLIGLAYHFGVDTETDPERAAALLECAANAGNTDACSRLEAMYRTGDGVPRDHETALFWQQRKTELLERAYRQSGTEESITSWMAAALDLVDGWCMQGDVRRAGSICGEMLAQLDQLETELRRASSAEGTAALGQICRRSRAAFLEKLGHVQSEQGYLSEALRYDLAAVDLMETLAKETDLLQDLWSLARMYRAVGDAMRTAGDLAEARDYLERSMEVREMLAARDDSILTQEALAVGYRAIGTIEEIRRDPAAAGRWYLKAEEILRRLVRQHESVHLIQTHSRYLNDLGRICLARGEMSGARKYFSEALNQAERLAEATGTPLAHRDLAVCYSNMGDLEQQCGRMAEAKDWYLRLLGYCTLHAESVQTVEGMWLRGKCLVELGGIERQGKHWENARTYYQTALNVLESAAEETETPEMLHSIGVCCDALGSIALVQRRLSEARLLFERSYEISWELAGADRQTPEEKVISVRSRREFSVFHVRMGYADLMGGQKTSAREHWRQALKLRRRIAEETDTAEADKDLAEVCYTLGSTGVEDTGESVRLLEESTRICRDRCRRSPEAEEFRELLERGEERLSPLRTRQKREEAEREWSAARISRLRRAVSGMSRGDRPALVSERLLPAVRNAIAAYAGGAEEGDVVAIWDMSFRKNGKKGILFTGTEIYFSETERPEGIPWDDIRSVSAGSSGELRIERRNGSRRDLMIGRERDRVLELLRKVL